jgi:hypothetical protein
LARTLTFVEWQEQNTRAWKEDPHDRVQHRSFPGMASLAAARPAMVSNLDRLRPILEDLGGGLGVTDPVSGEAVLELHP